MNRPIVTTAEIPRSYDFLKGWREALVGQAVGFSDLIGGRSSSLGGGLNQDWHFTNPLSLLNDHGGQTAFTQTVSGQAALVSGFGWSVGSGFGANAFKVDVGTVYASGIEGIDGIGNLLASPSAMPYGDLAFSIEQLPIQSFSSTVTALNIPAAPPGGSVLAYLVELIPSQADVTDIDDPNYSASGGSTPDSAILPFYNSANPQQPLAGPGGTDPTPTSSQTNRKANCTVQFSTNSPGTASTAAAAAALVSVDAGAVPYLLIIVNNGDTHVQAANVFAVGLGSAPAIGGGAPTTPYLRGLMQQHHLGVLGSAPQIDGAVEWKPLGPVPMNKEPFTGLGYLAFDQTLTPTCVAGPSPVVSCGNAGNDGEGILNVTFGSGNIPSTGLQLARITTVNGASPVNVSITLTGANFALAAGIYFGFQVNTAGTWDLFAFNITGGNVAVGAISIHFAYLATF